jgi:hypothetical protein
MIIVIRVEWITKISQGECTPFSSIDNLKSPLGSNRIALFSSVDLYSVVTSFKLNLEFEIFNSNELTINFYKYTTTESHRNIEFIPRAILYWEYNINVHTDIISDTITNSFITNFIHVINRSRAIVFTWTIFTKCNFNLIKVLSNWFRVVKCLNKDHWF